nr:diacylglycerol kinase 3 [Quercus suber]
MRVDKEELRRRLVMPQYPYFAMPDTIRLQDPKAGEARFHEKTDLNVGPTEAPVVMFINTCSCGRHGLELKGRLD